MNSKNIKVEEVLDFLNDNKTPVLLGKYAEQELVKLGLPTSADEFDNDPILVYIPDSRHEIGLENILINY